MDKQEMKVQALREALRERVSALTDEYENKIADLRVELTSLSLQLQEAQKELQTLRGDNVEDPEAE